MDEGGISTEIERLEKRAAIRERHANDREAEAPVHYSPGSASFFETLERVDEYREEARELRGLAARLRRGSR